MSHNLLDSPLATAGHEDQPYTERPVHLVNDRSIYFKGLFGMLLCILPGAIIGLVLVKICLDQAGQALTAYKTDPGRYKEASVQKVRSGRTMAYIGVAIFILEILVFVIYTAG